MTISAHLLTVIRKITIEDDLEEIIEGSPGQINSPTKKNQERNKRFLTLNEFNRLVFLTKNNDISEIIKDHVKLDENKMDLVVESNYKKSVKSRIDLVLPTQTNVNEFYEISKENLENNLLTYREIIIGNTLLKIEYYLIKKLI